MGGSLYGLLFFIVFWETGLVVTPFLPGNSQLFAVGALYATDGSPLSLPHPHTLRRRDRDDELPPLSPST
jgi:membrane protein DedA with SNARE-associated domain